MAGWQVYVKSLIDSNSCIRRAAIVGAADGTVWARSGEAVGDDFAASSEELKKFISLFNNINAVPSTGFVLEGKKYIVPRVEDNLIFGKKERSGVFAIKTKMAVIIACFEGDSQEGRRMMLTSFLESLQQLPKELTRNLFLIRELHIKVTKLRHLIREKKSELRRIVTNRSDAEAAEAVRKKHDEINALHKDIIGLCEEKVLLSNRCYELVDTKIRILDADLARAEKDLKQSIQSNVVEEEEEEQGQASTAAIKASSSGGGGALRRRDSAVPGGTAPKQRRVDSAPGGEAPESIEQLSGVALIRHITGASEAVDDMPVDPHEPVYCVCRDVSYGTMVCCDAPNCPIEWYHFACVGLTKAPKGNWLCPNCSKEAAKRS